MAGQVSCVPCLILEKYEGSSAIVCIFALFYKRKAMAGHVSCVSCLILEI